jgi:hypothetical protein
MKKRGTRTWGKSIAEVPEGAVEKLVSKYGWTHSIHVRGEANVRTTSAEFLKPYGRLGEVLRDALFEMMTLAANRGSSASAWRIRTVLTVFVEYLDWCIDHKVIPAKPTPLDLSMHQMRGYADWMVKTSKRAMNINTVLGEFKGVQHVLNAALELHRAEFPKNYCIPACPIVASRVHHTTENNVTIYDKQRLENIRKAAARHVASLMRRVEPPAPPRSLLELYPFHVYLAGALVANPSSLARIRRDCLKPHPVMPDTWVISWFKARSKRFQHWTVTQLADPLNPVAVIRFLLRWTEPLVSFATPPIDQYLLIYDLLGHGGALRFGRIHRFFSGADVWTKEQTSRPANAIFAEENKLLKFTVAALRESQVVQDYLKDGNARRVKEKLGHKGWSSVQFYLKSRLAKIKQAEVFSGVFDVVDAKLRPPAIPNVIDAPMEAAVGALNLSKENREKNLSGEYDAGLNGCKNPYRSPLPKQQTGRLCQLWHACLFCTNAFYTADHLPMILLRMRNLEKRRDISRDAEWGKSLDAEALRAIVKIVRRFSPETRNASEALADGAGEYDVLALAKQEIIFG